MSDTKDYRVTMTTLDGQAVVELAGEIDLNALRDMMDAFASAEADGGRLVIDMAGTSFIDSAGLKALLVVWRSRCEAGAEVVLRRPSPVVLRTLEIAGLADVLPIEVDGRA